MTQFAQSFPRYEPLGQLVFLKSLTSYIALCFVLDNQILATFALLYVSNLMQRNFTYFEKP